MRSRPLSYAPIAQSTGCEFWERTGSQNPISKVSSGGSFPNSVAAFDNLVYVLNAQGTANISAFLLDTTGTLAPLPNSTVNVPGGAASKPHDIRFSPDGSRLFVREEATNKIDIFDLGDDGRVTSTARQPAAGIGPFSLKFARGTMLVVTEADSASLSTYHLNSQDMLQTISAAVPNGQAASCWISITRLGHAFVSNTASGTLSSYQISADGTATLASAISASLASGAPIDSALSSDGKFLYVEDSALGRVVVFDVNGTNLSHTQIISGLPKSLQGIVAQ